MARNSLKLSEFGKDLVDKAARKRGWGHQEVAWAIAAYIDVSTLKRFWRGISIERGNFIAICQAVGIDWEKAVDEDEQEFAPKQINQVYPVALDSPFYIERPPIESLCYNQISRTGSLIRIKAPQQMGKTMLMGKIMDYAASQGDRTVILSLKLVDKMLFSNLDKFLRWFCTNVSRELELSSQVDNFWEEENTSSKTICTTYFEEYLLKQADSNLILGLDDVDLLFPYPEVYEDFFAMLRSWHERTKTRKLWKKLHLVVVYSTEVYIPLNIDQSPFNVGIPIELSEFTSEQVQKLANCYGLDWDASQIEQLMELVGGYPYLVQQALSYMEIHQKSSLEQVLENATTESGIYSHHLRQHLLVLKQHPELAIAMKKVIITTDGVRLDSILTYKLDRMGLVKLQGNEVLPSCNLYRQYFQDRLEAIL